MDTIDLVRQWKQPGMRQGEAVGHPAGEIRLRTAGGLARRAGLLGSHDAMRLSHEPWTTMTITFVPSEEKR